VEKAQDKLCLKMGVREAFDHQIKNKDWNRTPILIYTIFLLIIKTRILGLKLALVFLQPPFILCRGWRYNPSLHPHPNL
jgi:hypothetical protein